jgi:hypothetical protein
MAPSSALKMRLLALVACSLACTPEGVEPTNEAKRRVEAKAISQPEPEPQPEPAKPTTAVEPEPEPPPTPPPIVAVDLASYSRACKRHTDCVLVRSHKCSTCGCANEPIAKSEHPRFLEEVDAITCPPPSPLPGGAGCGGCIIRKPRCDEGTCVAK